MNKNFAVQDIVLAPFPFADHSVSKLRPAIIVSMLPQNAYLVCYITSAQLSNKFAVALDPNKSNGLLVKSYALVNRLTVISHDMITRKLGVLTKAQGGKISSKLVLMAKNFAQ